MSDENNKPIDDQPINPNSVAREFALRFIYHFQLDYFSKDQTRVEVNTNELVLKINNFKETIDLNVSEGAMSFCQTLILGVATNIEELGTIIENHLENWRLNRLHSVDLTILYLATYEILFYKKTT
ncbi:MAG: transcription antitermination factor NusB [Bacteriovoracaceae bacterium]